jgi:hypothetical protein
LKRKGRGGKKSEIAKKANYHKHLLGRFKACRARAGGNGKANTATRTGTNRIICIMANRRG